MFADEVMDLLLPTGPGTPCGTLMRSYWQPVALSSEVRANHAPVQLAILGEPLVLFRNSAGSAGLLDRYCPHRGADLSYGLCEADGLRCIYHGWKFAVNGQCLEQPAEPAASSFAARIKTRSYPVTERAGLIFAYLGAGEPPPFPDYEFLSYQEESTYVTKVFHECNYLQANEGNLDQSHLGFLHRLPPKDTDHETLKAAAPGGSKSPVELTSADLAPRIDLELTSYGFRELTERTAPEGRYLKVQSFVLPNIALFPGIVQGRDGYQVHWHVPVDDDTHWKFVLVFQRGQPLDKDMIEAGLLGKDELDAGYHMVRTRANHHLQDRAIMTIHPGINGLGVGFEIHDAVICESSGARQDRHKEHLGSSDRSVVAIRRSMLKAIRTLQDGGAPPHAARDPVRGGFPDLQVIAEVIPAGADAREYLAKRSARPACPAGS